MLQSDSFFAVIWIEPGHGQITIASRRIDSSGRYEVHLTNGEYTLRSGDGPVWLHNHRGFVCPPRADTKVRLRLSRDIGRVGHTFAAA